MILERQFLQNLYDAFKKPGTEVILSLMRSEARTWGGSGQDVRAPSRIVEAFIK